MTTMSALDSLPVPLLTYMRGFARRRRWQRLARRLGLAMLALLTFGLIACLTDRIIALPGTVRFALLIGSLALAGIVLWPALRGWSSVRTDWWNLAQQIERSDPICGERLLTVASRLLGRIEHAGSRALLDRLARELSADVQGRDVSRLLPARRVLRPWASVAVVLLIVVMMSMIPVLDMPALARRLVLPFSPEPPVTTTRLSVVPGNADLVEGQSFEVRVSARRLGSGDSVILRVHRPGQPWMTRAMSADSDGTYVCALGEIEDDVEYQAIGGDARSPLYFVRVLRKPIVTEFHIRYDYPDYSGLKPADVVNSTGEIEGPVGTKATVRIQASEPLAAATLTLGEQSVMMRQVGDNPAARQAQIAIAARDQKYELGMSSTRGMVGSATGTVRATEDRSPEIRILWPPGDQWVEPGSILMIGYEAGDDYGIRDLELHARVSPFGSDAHDNGDASTAAEPGEQPPPRTFRPPVDLRVRAPGDPRRLVGEFPLDLGALGLSPGDFASLRLRAQDRNGQSAMSDALYLVGSPVTVSQADRRYVNSLAQAAEAASALVKALEAGQPAQTRVPMKDLQRWLMNALHDARGASSMDVLEALVDRVQLIASRVAQTSVSPSDKSETKGMVRATAETIRKALDSRRAGALLADMENIAVAKKTLPASDLPPVKQLRSRVQRLDDEVQRQLHTLQLRRDDPQVATRLRRIAATHPSLLPLSEEDLPALGRRWHDELVGGRDRIALPSRLEMAARAQTLRADGDLIWARDLQRAATAAAHIEAGVGTAQALASIPPRFASALATLQRDHQQRRRRQHSPWRYAEADETAAARQQMTEWANDPLAPAGTAATGAPPPPGSTAARQLEALVMQASAETATRNFSNAAAIDRALAGEATPAARNSAASRFATGAAERGMSLIQTLDALVLQQDAIQRELEDLSARRGSVASLVERQQNLAHSVAELVSAQPRPEERARLDAAEAIVTIDGRLQSLPREIAARDRLSDLTYELEDQLERIGDALATIRRYPGDTMPALAQLRGRMLPALVELRSAAEEQRDAPEIVAKIQQLVDETRSALADALHAVLQADPLIAAQFRTARAARLISQEVNERDAARQELEDASAALRRAWREAVRHVALARAIRIPALAPIVWPGKSQDAADPQMPPVDPGPVPPGYEDAVKAYLEATGQRRTQTQSR